MTTGDWASPGQGHLLRADPAVLRDVRERRVLLGETLGVAQAAQRAPRQERQAQFRADVDLRSAPAEGGRELVLHAHQHVSEHGVGGADLVGVGVGEPDHADLPRVRDVLQRADDLVVGHLRVGPVVLPERDLVDAQPLQARVDRSAEVGSGAVDGPAPSVRAGVAALRREQHAVPDPELVEE